MRKRFAYVGNYTVTQHKDGTAPVKARATESVNPRKASPGPCGVCERPDVAHRCMSCGWRRA